MLLVGVTESHRNFLLANQIGNPFLVAYFLLMASGSSRYDKEKLQVVSQHADSLTNIYRTGGVSEGISCWQSGRCFQIHQ